MKRATTMLSAFAVVLALAPPSWAQVRELPKHIQFRDHQP